MASDPGQQKNLKKLSRAVIQASIVFAGFLCLFIAVIIAEYWRGKYSSLLDSEEIEELHQKLAIDSASNDLKDNIRQKDLELRKDFFRRQIILDRGRYIILACALAFFICVKYVLSLNPKLPTKKKKE